MEAHQSSPLITQAQFEIWLSDPVTRRYLYALDEIVRLHKQDMGEGAFVHLTDSYKTQSESLMSLGTREGMTMAGNPEAILLECELLEPKEEPKESEEDAEDGA